MSGVDSSPLDYTGDHTREEVAQLEEKRVTQSIKKQEVKHMTDDQRKAAEERERKAREEEERQRAAADKLERKRREAEARMRTQQHPVGGAVPSESNAEANRAAAADVLKFAVADKIKAKMAAMPETWHFAVGGTCLCIVLIISIVLIAVSFSTLEPNEVGLDVNANTMYLDKETLWKNGRHFLGLGHYFIVFPTEVRETEVDVVARSIDGASVSMKCSFQWQIEPDVVKVVGLYTLFEEKYAAAFDKIANDEIRNVAAQYTAFDFFFKRTEITLAMSTALDTTLSLVGITVSGFQLLNFDVPPAFSATVQLTEETKQRKTRAESNQQKANITAQAKIETAKEDATVLRVQAEATAVAFVQEKSAQRDSVAIRLTAERESYKNMKQNLTLTTADLLTIIWLTAVQASPAPQLLNVDVPKGVQVESIASPTPAPTTALTESPATVSPTTDAATTAPATTPVAAPTTTGAATTRTSAPATTTL